jgi:hypothetical protein
MSTEIILHPRNATKDQLRKLLVSHGYIKCEHLWEWPKGSLNFFWFENKDFKSTDGVEATIYPASEELQKKLGFCPWALHTRTRASASRYDKEKQNETIRSARKHFGGKFYNDWHGYNRYTPLWEDPRLPEGRGIFFAYKRIKNRLDAIRPLLPDQKPLPDNEKIADLVRLTDPTRILYNALIPFAVSAIEHFFSQTFQILLHYDNGAQKKLKEQSRKIEISNVVSVVRGERQLEAIISDWYSFQNLSSINAAYRDWFGIDVLKILRRRRKIGKRIALLEQRLNQLIEFRHGVIHHFAFDYRLGRDEFLDFLTSVDTIVETFVDYLEKERGILIRAEFVDD